MRRGLAALALLVALVVLAACGMTGEQMAAAHEALDAMVARGDMTPNEAKALRDALDAAAAPRWIEPLFGFLGTLATIYLWRGPSATAGERVVRKNARRR